MIKTLEEDDPTTRTKFLKNINAEQALLGALMINNKALESVIEFLEARHFADDMHSKIYETITYLIDKGKVADPITLQNYFETENIETDSNYLVQLVDNVVSVVNVKEYGRLIYDLFLRRELIDIGETIVHDARSFQHDVDAIKTIENSEQKLYKLATVGSKGSEVVPFKSALADAIEKAEQAFKRDSHIIGVTTGFVDLDRMLGGFHDSDLIILAGRPSMGKTALATNIAFNAAHSYLKTNEKEGAPIAFFSLEMSSEQLASRILSAESGIPSDYIRRGEIKFNDFPKFVEVGEKLHNLKLYIDDTPGISMVNLRNRARRMKRQFGIKLIVIDYLQLITTNSSNKMYENRVQEVSEITRSLKALAKELEVPVLALSQLSRAVEQREDKKPQLADLRESGTIEQDSDVVMFIFRQEYYESRKQPESGTEKHAEWLQKMEKLYNKAELIVAKQRHGPIGNITLFYDGRLTKFKNWAD